MMSIEIGGRSVTVAAAAASSSGRRTVDGRQQRLVGAKRMLAVTPEKIEELQAERQELQKWKRDSLLGSVLKHCVAIRGLCNNPNMSMEQKIENYLQKRRELLTVIDDWTQKRLNEGGVSPDDEVDVQLNSDKKAVPFEERFGAIIQQFSGSPKNKSAVEKILRAMNGDSNIQFDSGSYDVIINGERLGVNLTDMLQDLIRPTHFSNPSTGEVSKALKTFLKEMARNSTLGVRSIPNQQLQNIFKNFRDGVPIVKDDVEDKKHDGVLIVKNDVEDKKRDDDNGVVSKKVRLYIDPKMWR